MVAVNKISYGSAAKVFLVYGLLGGIIELIFSLLGGVTGLIFGVIALVVGVVGGAIGGVIFALLYNFIFARFAKFEAQ
jgi:uncharacterized membrane protein